LSKLGMERQVKPLASIQTSCCSEETKSEVAPLKTLPMADGCCSSESVQPATSIPLPMFQTQSSSCCAVEVVSTAQKLPLSSCCSVSFEADETTTAPFKEKIKRASVSAVETFKGVFWYLLLGAGIGAFIYGFFPQDLLVRLAGPENPFSIPVAALIGVPMYIRAETVIPISAALVGKGMGVGTVLALVVGGAGASIPELIILASMFKKKLIFAFAANVFLVAVVAGYLVEILIY